MSNEVPNPGVVPLELGTVLLPDNHPRASDGLCAIRGFAIEHPDGVIVVDTGAADDHPVINELYRPTIVPLIAALNDVGIDERNVVAILNTHLHFDHCGQNRALPNVPVFVQAAELEAAKQPMFTVPEWAEVLPSRRRVLDRDEEIAPGVRVVATPGHTPGHQSVVLGEGADVEVIVGQCCYSCREFSAGELLPADMHELSLLDEGLRSLNRLRSLHPTRAHFSHDARSYERSPSTRP